MSQESRRNNLHTTVSWMYHAHGDHYRINSGKVKFKINVPVCAMLKHTCAWCRHTRGRFGRTHGSGREGVVVSLVFFIGKTSAFLMFVEHHLRMLGSFLIANFLLAMNGPRGVITCPRGSTKAKLDLSHFKFVNWSRTTRARSLQSFALPDGTVILRETAEGTSC